MLRELAPRLAGRGHDVTVFGDRSSMTKFRGVQISSVPTLRTKYLETVSRSALSTFLAIRQKFDIVHFHDAGPALFAPACDWFDLPTLLTLHSLDWKRAKWPKLSQSAIHQIERFAVRRVNAITVVSRVLQKYLNDVYELKSTFLPNVVESTSSLPSTRYLESLDIKPQRYILFVGRLSPEKAAHELVEAFRQLQTDINLLIVGDTGDDETYTRNLMRMAHGSNIFFLGRVTGEALTELYSNAYLFVLPSYVEGRSMALLEAIACQTPILVSDLPENMEVVGSAQCAFATGNIGALTDRLRQLISNPSEVSSIQDHIMCVRRQQQTWNDIVDGYEDIYTELVRDGR